MSDSDCESLETRIGNIFLIGNMQGRACVVLVDEGELTAGPCEASFQSVANEVEFPVISIVNANEIDIGGLSPTAFAVNPNLIRNVGPLVKENGNIVPEGLPEDSTYQMLRLEEHREEPLCYIRFDHPTLEIDGLYLYLPVHADLIERALTHESNQRPAHTRAKKRLISMNLN